MRKILTILGALALAACNPFAQQSGADSMIDEFHEAYSQGEWDAIYAGTGEELKEVTSAEQWNELMVFVSDRMGAFEDSSQTGIDVNTSLGDTTTVITLQSTFEQGEGTEIFTFLGNGEEMRLVGWEVNSEQLIVQPGETMAPQEQPPAADTAMKPQPAE